MAISEELRVEVKVAVDKAIADLDRFKSKTAQTDDKAQKFIKTAANWAASLTGVTLGLMTVRKAIDYAFDAAQVAAKANQIEKALDNLAKTSGMTAAEIVGNLKKTSKGTISELDLMRSASKAALFNLPMNQLDKLMAIARASATATGESVQYMFDSIVTGIARGSPMILDNLGLTLKIGEATETYAKSIGKTAEQLTAEERKQATLNATLKAGEDILKRVGDATDELTDAQRMDAYVAAVANLKKEIGTGLLPAYREVLGATTQIVNNMAESLRISRAFNNVNRGEGSLEDQLIAINYQIDLMRGNLKNMPTVPTLDIRGGNLGLTGANLKELEKQREALLRQKAALELIESKKADALKAAQKRAEDEEKRVAAAAEYQLKLKTAYEKTEAGQKEATKTAIAYWEAQLAKGKNVKEISAILEDLKKSIEEESFAMSNMTNNWVEAGIVLGNLRAPLEVAKESFEAIGQGFGQVGEWSAPLDAAYQSFLGIGQGFGQIGEIIEETTEKIWENKDAMRALSHSVSDILDSLGTVWSNYYAAQMEGLDKSSDEYKKIAREQASAEKAWGIFMALINTAVAVTKALSSAPPPWNIALATAAGIAGAAQVAAIASQPLPALGEGGIVTKPTYALMGEKGPEAVIPLNKSSGAGLGNITIIVNGSVMEEEGLARKLGGIIARQRRGY